MQIIDKFVRLAALIIFLIPASSYAQNSKCKVTDEELHNDWQIQSSSKVLANGEEISSIKFKPQNWYAAKVPNSTLGSLVADGLFKNIFFNRNLEKVPDSLFDASWWYRRTFKIEKVNDGQVYCLRFNGISYRGDVWLNGKKIASADTVKGSFRQFIFNISSLIKHGENVLALKVTQAGPGELNIGFVDWNPEPADNHMGIWRDVHLLGSGPVSIEKPFVVTDIDTATLDHANITIKVMLHNHSGKSINGILQTSIAKDMHISKPVSLMPHESKEIILTPAEDAALSIDHPKLWWTHDLGKPNLYTLDLNYIINTSVSDRKKIKFGIRSVSGYMTDKGFRAYRLNGKKILIKGGGWSDPMLLNATPSYETAGIDYAVHMNLNAIRMEGFWGQNQHIYDLCDERGILIMVGFSCQWEWKGIFGTPDDKYGGIKTDEQIDMAAKSWNDQVVWLRNHPSIFLWLYGSDKWPRPELELKYLNILKNEDTTRPYAQSAKEWTSEITGPTGMKMRGPYDYVPPLYWYADTSLGGAFGFNTETGPGPQIPVLESLKKMIPKDSLWPIGSAWLYHAARGKFHNLDAYNNAMAERLGKANDLEDYLRKAQYLNYEGMRAMFEAFEVNRFKATGIIQWMYNASWPKLWWQLYDYYLMPTGAFYGARKANESLHISFNYATREIDAINNTAEPANELFGEINVYDFNMKIVLQKTLSIANLASQETRPVFTLPHNMDVSKTWFLDLRLFDKRHKEMTDNFYVLSTQKDSLDEKKSTWYVTPQSQYANLSLLEQLPNVKLETTHTTTVKEGNTIMQVKVKNPSDHLAFMVNLDLKKARSNESVVPVFWEQNYFTLLPGEERTVSVLCHTADLGQQSAKVIVSGWNVE
ncbi:glycoside hydrolase family 2 [Ginsengibacter hankyongi]|uniref:Glycoside hydrolase family 2 n=1 Tax=Ginsengibacter hankyongi TaxID=2607284 RepID=A0A5J5ILA4_9BACT|nr:sugar-binding domain-containing protein [Ginsengibacter hankyongi]KAA9039437.1 glycoside hydrolase family 2 [Ginsengibacter hankyongi]